jgi:hypothetical protein
MTLGNPHTMFFITTLKENSQPNATSSRGVRSPSMAAVILPPLPLLNHMHAHAKILRPKRRPTKRAGSVRFVPIFKQFSGFEFFLLSNIFLTRSHATNANL